MPVISKSTCPGCGLTLFFAVENCPACGKDTTIHADDAAPTRPPAEVDAETGPADPHEG